MIISCFCQWGFNKTVDILYPLKCIFFAIFAYLTVGCCRVCGAVRGTAQHIETNGAGHGAEYGRDHDVTCHHFPRSGDWNNLRPNAALTGIVTQKSVQYDQAVHLV